MRRRWVIGALAAAALLSGPAPVVAKDAAPPAIIGSWLIRVTSAPFPEQLFAFHADGTVIQAAPDAGHATTSDSPGIGVWVGQQDGTIRGRVVAIQADPKSHALLGRGELRFLVRAAGDRLSGNGSQQFYGVDGRPTAGPFATGLTGYRITP